MGNLEELNYMQTLNDIPDDLKSQALPQLPFSGNNFIPKSYPQNIKPGWKTSEFWIVVLSMITSDSATLAHLLDPKWAAIVMAVGSLAYALSRGLAKQ